MELYKEILANIISKEEVQVTFSNLNISAKEIIELECYKALNNIKAIIEDDSLEDVECFMKIEKIICLLEDIGSSGGNRHDFG